ncbi:MAG TPA: hypothetical protein VN442_03155 [Bryobacteraceae bacterium]|nr:hypothetical protein [Bryobacteraceae bacterium]
MQQRSTRWAAAFLLAAAVVFFRKVLFQGDYTFPWDFLYYHYPLSSLMTRAFASGEFPLWDTSTYCGRPFYALLQSQAFYPPAILTSLAGAVAGERRVLYLLELQAVAHVFLAGLFTFGLLRALRVGVAAALAGALVYQLGAFFTSQAQHLGAVDAAAWMPLAWHAVILLGRGFTWRRMALLVAALAMSFLAGFTAVTIVVFGSAGMLALALAAVRSAPVGLPFYVIAGAAWAALVSAIQLFPTMELAGLSVAAQRAQYGNGSGMPLEALITLLWPNWWGVFEFGTVEWKLPFNATFVYLYCGIPALVFAVAALVRRAGRQTAVFAGLAVAFAFWMLGNSTVVGRTLVPLLPGTLRGAMYVEFAMAAFVLALAVLAGLGADALLAGRGRALHAAVVLLVAADLVWAGSGRPFNTSRGAGIDFAQIDGVREIPAVLRDLSRRTTPPARIDNMGGSSTWTGCSPLFDVPSANGDDPFALTRLIEVRNIFGQGNPWERYRDVVAPGSPVLDLLNVEYLVARTGAPSHGLERAANVPGMAVYRNPGALPRFFLVGRTHRAANLADAVALMRAPEFDPSEEAVVEGVAVRAEGSGTVRVKRYGTREIELETEAALPALLVTSEAWYPGWRAWVDGSGQPLILTNAAFRGLEIPAGRHTVRMRFDPPVLWRSGMVSLAALLALAGLVAAGDNRRRKA